MARYLTQEKEHDCSPVAVVNALEWASKKRTTKDQKWGFYIIALAFCKTDKDGTYDYDFDHTIRGMGRSYFTVRKPRKYNTNQLTKHLDKGGAVILAHYEHWEKKDAEWHHSLFIKHWKGWYLGVNVKAGKRFFVCRKELFDKMATGIVDQERPEAWLLTKKDTQSKSDTPTAIVGTT